MRLCRNQFLGILLLQCISLFIVTTIGFSPITYREREEVGFVTLRIVASNPLPIDTVLQIDEVIGGTATSMYYYCDKYNLILNSIILYRWCRL